MHSYSYKLGQKLVKRVVLILVLMEDALVHATQPMDIFLQNVLILVLMEDALVRTGRSYVFHTRW